MKKTLLIAFALALLAPLGAKAQELAAYQLATSTTTYASIASTGTQLDSVYGDAGNQTIVMPFDFNIGERYINRGTRLRVRADGHLFFPPASSPTDIGGHFAYNYWTGAGFDGYSVIVPYLCTDGGMAQNESGVYYQLETSGTDSVLVIEFAHVYRWNNASTTDFNYQVRLHKGGVISITYGTMTNNYASLTEINCLITNGLEDHLLLSGTWANPTIASPDAISYLTGVPASGTVLTFTPVFPTCMRPVNLASSHVTHEGAILSWMPRDNPSSYRLYLSTQPGFSIDTCTYQTVSDTTTTLTGLNQLTNYYWTVVADCGGGDLSDLPTVQTFSTLRNCGDGNASIIDVIGTGTSASNSYMAYNNSSTTTYFIGHSANIFTAAEMVDLGMEGEGFINSISLHAGSTASNTPLRVYVGKTALTEFGTSASDTTGLSHMTLVFDDTLHTTAQEWVDIPFNTPFPYSPDSNLVIYFYRPGPASANGNFYYTTTTPHNRTFYGYRSSTSTANPSYTRTYLRVNVKFDICYEIPTCTRPTDLAASDITSSSVTLSWTGCDNATGYQVTYSDGVHSYSASSPTTSITIDDLVPGTTYTFDVKSVCGDDVTFAESIMATTACAVLTTLPYTQTFEGAETTSSSSTTFVNCMGHLNNATSYFGFPTIGTTAGYNHTPGGTKGLYWSGYATTLATYGDYQVVVLPAVDTDYFAMNTLQLRFWARVTIAGYMAPFQVGVMTDPTDVNTFQLVQNIMVNGNTDYAEFIVPLANFTGYGQYVAIKAVRATTTWYATMDDITLELMPNCPEIVNLEASTTPGSALLTWGYREGYDEPAGYEVTYDSVGSDGSSSNTITVSSPSAVLTGLAAGTDYKAYVRADCGSEQGAVDSIEFSTGRFNCLELDPESLDTVLFSTSTTGQTGCIAYSSYGNTAYQALYTAAELTAAGLTAGPITGIDLGFTGCTTFNKEFTIFMANTSTTAISSTTFEVPTADMQVYGPAAHPMNTTGWQHYNFTTPFNWDGVSSIIVTTFMNQSGASQSNSTGLTGYYVTAANRARYRYVDNTAFTLANVATTGTGASSYSYRAAIHFYSGDCQTMATCAAPAVTVTGVDATSATLSWAPGASETSWNVDCRVQGATEWINATSGVTATTYTVNGLNAGTDYEFRVSFECGDDDNTLYAATATAFTPCLPVSLPYSEDFDAITTSTSTTNYGLMPNCWDYTMTGTSSYQTGSYLPKVYYNTTYAHSGNYSLYLNGVGYYVLPEMPTSVDSLMISFYDYTSSASYGLIVGAIEDGMFVPIDTAQLTTSTFNFVEFNLNRYTGTSRLLALRNYYNSSTTIYYSYHYIDDIYVDYIPSCPHVENLAVDTTTENSVTLTWTAGGTESLWSVSDGHGYYATTSTPSATITGLTANTPYTFEVRALCDATDSSRAMNILARTACETYMTLPYTDDFEGYTNIATAVTGVQLPCWNWLMTGTASYQALTYQPQLYYSTSTAYSHSGNYSLRLYGVSYTTLQQLPVDANMVSMGFWTRSSSASGLLYVGVMTDPNDPTTFDTIQQITNAGTSVPEYHEIDFSSYTGNGRYIAFRNVYNTTTTYYSTHYIDDIEVWQNSSCATPTSLTMSNISNNSAILGWIDTSNSYNGASIFWGTAPNRGAVTDSGTVTGTNSFILTGLTGNTTYYVWIQGECTAEPSRAMMTSFTTTPDCMPVENLTVASVGNHAFSLTWSAPTSGNAPSGYIVSWTRTGYDSVHVDTVTNTYYYADGLAVATNYTYAVSTLCGNLVVEGEPNYLTTTLCTEETTGEYATNFSALPVRAASPYSYTQQIYLAEELAGIDSISAVAFYNDGYAYNRRNVTVYLGNTSKSVFTSGTDFIPLSSLTQVYSGPYEGFGWFTMHFTQTFVRDVDSNLVLVVDDNTGTAWTANTAYFASSNLVDTMRAVYTSNTSDINPANPTTGTGYTSQYRNHVIFTPADCQMTDCDIPVLTVLATTGNSVSVQWAAEAGTSYTVEYRMANTTAWTTFEAGNTTGTCVVNTLSPSETWEIRVGYSCEGSTVYGIVTATTQCGAAALPIAEDFESNGYGDFVRPCWVVGQTRFNGTDVYPRVTRLTGGDDFLLFLYHGAYLILPRVNAPLNELQLSFKLTQGGTNARLLLGVIADQSSPITSMIVLDTLVRSRIDSTTSTVNIDYSLENIDTAYNNYHLAFYDAFSDNYSFLNDIVLDYIPACTPPNASLDAVTTTTATISWNTDGENATGYYVVYGPRGFVPGGEGSDTLAPATTPATITGLAHSTNYDAYVYTVCSGIGSTSAASQVVQFTTACAPVTALPYTMDFEHVMPAGNTSADMVPNCWVSESLTGTGRPRTFYTTESGYTASGNYCLYFSDLGVVALPEMSAPLNTLSISFREYCTTPATQGLIVGTVSTDAEGFASTFVPYDTLTYDLNTNTYNRTVYFSDYMGTATRIAFKNVTTNGTTSVHYLDNVVVDVQPSCITPQNLRTTYLVGNEANLEWNRSNSSSYTVIYGVHDSATVTTSTTDRSILLTGLTPQTQYDVALVGDCSTDTVLYSFTTPCVAVSLPYTENFDAIRNTTTNGTADYGIVPDCWSYIMTGTATYQTGSYVPRVYYSSTYASSGNYSLYLNGVGYTMLPPVPTSLDSLQITFNTYTTSASYGLVVGVMEGTHFVPVDTVNTLVSTHQEVIVKFDTYHGSSRIIALRNYYTANTTGNLSYQYIDDIEVDYIPTCPKIVNLDYTDATENSVTLSWNTTGTESEWVVSYGNTSVVVYDSMPTITGLLADSAYTFAVRPLCDVADTGRARYITVRTTCNPVSLPYTENFDAIRTTTTNGAAEYGLVPSCWSYIMTGTATYQTGSYLPKVYYSASYSHSGSYCLYLYGESYTILPPMPTSLDSLELTFWDYTTSTNYLLEVGVMEGTTFVPVQAISTPASTHMEQTVYFGTYTGTSRTIAFRNHYTTSTTTYYSYHYIDDVQVDYLPSCAPVYDIHAVSAGVDNIVVDWSDMTAGVSQWQVRYGVGSNTTTISATSHPVTISGLDTLTTYQVSVRPICSATDTGDWSAPVSFGTEMCDNAFVASTGQPTGTGYYTPVNNYFRFTLTETIIDSAELAGIGDISAIAYSYAHTTASVDKTNVTIWIQPTTKSVFTGSTDLILLDTTTAVQVYSGALNCSQGWNYFALDTDYVWDGHSNLVVIVDDNSNEYDGSTYVFNTSNCTGYKTLAWYSDSQNPDPTSTTFSGTKSYYQYRATMKLVSCSSVCREPVIDSVVADETTVTLTWNGNASSYEVYAIAGNWDEPTAGIAVTASPYTFTGLTPGTAYAVGVRSVCANGPSDWVYDTVTTDEHPCIVPTNLAFSDVTFNSATLSWTPGEAETEWDVHITGTNYDQTFTVTTNPYIATGLASGVEYTATVRARCSATQQSDWSNPVTFTTATCQPVSNVTVDNRTTTTAQVHWTAPAGVSNFDLEYGASGFAQGSGTHATATTNSVTLTGLTPGTMYDVYVRSVCADGIVSNWSSVANFETRTEGIDDVNSANIVLFPNPATTTVTLTGIDGQATVTIVDMNGRVSGEWKVENGKLTIDLTGYAQGAYFVRITGEQLSAIRKLIVK